MLCVCTMVSAVASQDLPVCGSRACGPHDALLPLTSPLYSVLTTTVTSAPGIEAGPVVLKHPASEAEIQPQTPVTLRCHIDGHPR